MSKIKVMHLLKSDKFSGAENVVCQIIDLCKDDGKYDFIYCSSEGPIRDTLTEKKINFFGLNKVSIRNVKNAISVINPDIIHAHDMGASFLASLVCGKRKLIITIHNNAPENAKKNIKTLLFNFATRKASHIFWVSDSAYNDYYFINKVREKSSVLYNIIDIPKLYYRASQDSNDYNYDILFLGRITFQKNPQRLLEVFRALSNEYPDVRLAIAGTGEMEEEIKSEAYEMGLINKIDFLGFVDNPYKLLKTSKIMIMTSRWEGTPMSALEAMALGVPIVSTPTDGLKKVVIDGETGYLSDDNKVIINKCITIIKDPLLRKKLSTASINRAKELMDTEFFKREIEKAYDEL